MGHLVNELERLRDQYRPTLSDADISALPVRLHEGTRMPASRHLKNWS
jgi:hypothetical protein